MKGTTQVELKVTPNVLSYNNTEFLECSVLLLAGFFIGWLIQKLKWIFLFCFVMKEIKQWHKLYISQETNFKCIT